MTSIRETRLTSAASAAAIALQLMLVNGAFGQTTTWVATSGGNWNATSSWNNGIPNSATATAVFNAVNGQAYNVSIFKNESFTVGTLNLVGDVGRGPILNTTSGTLNFDGAATINSETHPAAGSGINVKLVFLKNGTINTSTADSLLNISSPTVMGSGVSLTKIGPGEVQFGSDTAISLTGALNVNEGTLTIFNALDIGTSAGAKPPAQIPTMYSLVGSASASPTWLAAKKSNTATTPFILLHPQPQFIPWSVNDVPEHPLTIFPVSTDLDRRQFL
jgi:autotransporter-associated beta strand protein